MARIRSIEHGTQNVKAHPSEVDCFVQDFEAADGTKLLHLSTFGSSDRASQPKSSQSIQLDREQAMVLRDWIDNVFG
ncbi:hypothetical protein [Schumannella soli]|uniref:Uncharacterized protein n=1 Tax=Schumannella soli TaxID=2590779 RepID=A0A506Y1A5_9MICO|nr:hypothetical protein [Schumannella soli]TPW75732.1 hypothetical protein FJ657_07605 [Schumannella soli]